jgi:hypothetical protein
LCDPSGDPPTGNGKKRFPTAVESMERHAGTTHAGAKNKISAPKVRPLIALSFCIA